MPQEQSRFEQAIHPALARYRRESVLAAEAESDLIANSGRTLPPLSPSAAVARILLPTATAGWVGAQHPEAWLGAVFRFKADALRSSCTDSSMAALWRSTHPGT